MTSALLLVIAVGATQSHGIDISGMDRSVVVKSPADLYNFANGSWFDRTAIPPAKANVGTFEEIQEHNFAILRTIVEEAASRKLRLGSSPIALVGALYRMAMDVKSIEARGGKPLAPELARIDAVSDRSSLVREIAHLDSLGVPVGFAVRVRPDPFNATRMLLTLSQGGFILPDRQLYVDNDDRSKALRGQYWTTMAKLMSLAKVSDPAAQADASLRVERILAKAANSQTVLQNAQANNHVMTLAELGVLTPSVDWSGFLTELGAEKPDSVNLCQPRFLQAFSQALTTIPIVQWRSYLIASVLYAWSPYLSNDFVKSQRSLTNDITGATEMEPRWKRAIDTIDSVAGDALGQLYVEKAFSPEARDQALRLVENIKSALRNRIQELDWLAPQTSRWAISKLWAMTFKVGYPSVWQDYSGMQLKRDSYLANVVRIQNFDWKRQLAKLGKPVDRSEWEVTASTVGAIYNPVWNEIVVPAGILQPGLFNAEADSASNYGAIGAIVGHEMTHGFDDLGSQYDAFGNLKNWWTPEDKEHFLDASSHIRVQYDAYRSPEDLPVSGALTMREDVADIGGLNLAYLAFHKLLGGASPPIRDGLTGDQRFFVAYAQIYRSHYRPDIASVMIHSNPHAPDPVRVQGALTDQPAFYKAFGLAVPKNLPQIW